MNPGFKPRLHFVDVPLEAVLERAAERDENHVAGFHAVTAADIRHPADIFERSTPDEGMPIETVTSDFHRGL